MRTARVGPGLGSSAGLGVGAPLPAWAVAVDTACPRAAGLPGPVWGLGGYRAYRPPMISLASLAALRLPRSWAAAPAIRIALDQRPGDFGAASLRLGRPGPTAAPQPRPEHPGDSFRLREKRQAGLFPPQQYLAASREEAGHNYPDWQTRRPEPGGSTPTCY